MALSPVRQHPKLSASQLADYLVAPTPIGQLGILRQAKHPGESKPLIIQYQHARRCISSCLQAPTQTNNIVAGAITNLQQRRDDPANSSLIRDDAARSIEIVETFQRTLNALDIGESRYEAAPNPSSPLSINGTEITVWPDAIARLLARNGEPRVGEVFIRCTMGVSGETAENRRAEANGHLATIAHIHASQFLGHLGVPYAPASIVIDISRETVTRGPINTARRVANIEAACRMIAAVWPTV